MPSRRQPAAGSALSRSPHRSTRRRLVAGAAAVLVAAAGTLVALVAGPRLLGDARAAGVPAGSPYGVAEHMYQQPGGMLFIGWAIDPSKQSAPVTSYVMVDNKLAGYAGATLPRPDVAKAHPAAGPNHGFKYFVPIAEGKHTICVRARNFGAGVNVNLRCAVRTLDYGPFGAIQSVRAAAGHLSISGWTIDGDQRTAPLTVSVSVDGQTPTTLTADKPNSAALKRLPTAGANHGFALTQAVSQGQHTVCVKATNIGFGKDKTLGCPKVTLNDSPLGHFDAAARAKDKLRITGWALDTDAPTTALTALVKVDGTTHRVSASATRTDVAATHPRTGQNHGFDVSYAVGEGSHTVCVSAVNVSYGSDTNLGCKTTVITFTPTASATALKSTATGAKLTGWASDPDTNSAISVRVLLDGRAVSTVAANGAGSTHNGHNFTATVTAASGKHTVCAVGLNVVYGTHNSPAACKTITLALSPLGKFESLARAAGSSDLHVTGWALDPDTRSPITVAMTLDGRAAPSVVAAAVRSDVAKTYPTAGSNHGLTASVPANAGEHTLCLTARNVSGGKDTSLGCKLIFAVNPVAPSAPTAVTAQGGYGAATVSWTPPASDGGAPWTKYVVTASPGGASATVAPDATTATVGGLKSSTTYTFSVVAVNVAGSSPAGVSPAVKTQAGPPPQTTPAPISTSRYIRNVRGASASELTTMRSEGATDAYYNPSGHRYLVLLDIGGQDHYDGGVVLSATTRFVSYGNLVSDIKAYVDGYASRQRAGAPATVAIGTNNDMDVSATAGAEWANKVVDPIVSYAKKYPGIKIAGANDIEPGFRASYSATASWLRGYLGATSAPFVFNGSADGCAWTTTNRSCNNGWSMAGLYYLAAGAAPTRTVNLPQIYNYTMADQWKYISLTGVVKGQPRINFGGTLTEWTACDQTNSCGSLTGRSAWSKMWSNLQSDSRLKVASLPYATDLRIDR